MSVFYSGPSPRESGAARSVGKTEIFVIGIDFGTTFTGVAAGCSNKPDDISIVGTWPDNQMAYSDTPKTPTAIYYNDSGRSKGIEWGAAIGTDKDALRWFKLLLARNEDHAGRYANSPHVVKARQMVAQLAKPLEKIIADFLEHLWAYCQIELDKRFGNFRRAERRIVMTVPAIWGPAALQCMSEAVRLARLVKKPDHLSFVQEPEAAAVAVLTDLKERAEIETNDCFTVVDCGGGTVDLISYRVTKASPLAVKEIVEGNGDLCGAKVCDGSFVSLLERKLGPERWSQLGRPGLDRIVSIWEAEIKPFFGRSAKVRSITMPVDCLTEDERVSQRPPCIILEPSEIKEVFASAFERIFEMVRNQIKRVKAETKANPRYIILVGGFGRCKYLYEEMQDEIKDTDIQILQPDGDSPWVAVCRGAAMRGLAVHGIKSTKTVDIGSRVARASYGVVAHEQKINTRHAKMDMMYDAQYDCMVASNQMKWLLVQGKNVSNKKSIEGCFRAVITKGEQVIEHRIYTSKRKPAPKRLDDTVSVACVIRCHVNKIVDLDDLEPMINKAGKKLYELVFKYHMLFHGAKFDFIVYYGDQKLGSKSVSIDFVV